MTTCVFPTLEVRSRVKSRCLRGALSTIRPWCRGSRSAGSPRRIRDPPLAQLGKTSFSPGYKNYLVSSFSLRQGNSPRPFAPARRGSQNRQDNINWQPGASKFEACTFLSLSAAFAAYSSLFQVFLCVLSTPAASSWPPLRSKALRSLLSFPMLAVRLIRKMQNNLPKNPGMEGTQYRPYPIIHPKMETWRPQPEGSL